VQGCVNTRVGTIVGIDSEVTIKVATSQNTTIEMLNNDSEDIPPSQAFVLDSVSDLRIGTLYNRRGQDAALLTAMAGNFIVDRYYNRAVYADAATGFTPIEEIRWIAGQNLLRNGSFEAGRYGWTFSNNPDTLEEYITSTVGAGLMGHFKYSSAGVQTLTQNITVPANVPVTLTAIVNCVAGTAWINPYLNGLGITASTGYQRATVGAGWQIISQTVTPQSAGSLTVGLYLVNTTEVYVDELSVSVGKIGVPNLGKFGTMEIGGSTVNFASAAPTTGAWKLGDATFNNAPSAGGIPGWVCTSAGSPGTWTPMVTLSKQTGWNAPTVGGGGLLRGTYDTGANLLTTAETLAALITDLRTSGIIGT
jgi:hypothetical protein